MPRDTYNQATIWPHHVRVQFREALRFYSDNLEETEGALLDGAQWGPWRRLSRQQGEWMLGRLADIWVQKNVSEGNATAWDDGGAWEIWKFCFEVWADMDADREEGNPEEEFMTAGLVKMIRRFNRATGERDSPRIPAKIIHPHPTRPGVRFAKNEFEEESELFLEGLYRDEDFLYLQQTEGDLIVPPPPALATTLGIDGAYYRCPIPESVEKPDLTWARERLLKVVPR